MSGTEALAAFTTGARWAAFEEERLGRLEAGYLADLTVLSVDPTTASPDAIATAQALLTMVGGEVLYLRPGAEAPRVDPVTTSTRAE
jgi:predicted amidohydrolase YtcJ